MDRRDFLGKISAHAGSGVCVGLTGAALMSEKVTDCAEDCLEIIKRECAALRKEVEKLDQPYKTALRAVLVTTSIATGIDLIALL
jgi:nitrate reductase assembly molybdenum cofactor insertion protein NarJ